MFLWSDAEFIVECMMPNLLPVGKCVSDLSTSVEYALCSHVVPVCYDAMFDGVFEGKNSALGLSLVASSRPNKLENED